MSARELTTYRNTRSNNLCFLVDRFPGYRSRGPVSIPGATRISVKYWVWNGVLSASWVQLRSYLEDKVAAPVWKTEIIAVGIRHVDHVAHYQQKLALTSLTRGGSSVGIVRSRTQATEFS
jgi:hypothetical protein